MLRLSLKSCIRRFSNIASGPDSNKKFVYPIWKSLGVLLVTSGGLWYYYRQEKNRIAQKRNLEKAGAVGTPLIGGPFNLIDSNGSPFSDKDLRGKYYLLYFGFTHCPDICPEELNKISEITRIVKAQKGKDVPFVPVFVTCDPNRDTPSVIKSYLKDFGEDFIGLTGPSDLIKSVAKSFRIYYRQTPTSSDGDYLVDHSIFFYLMGPDGTFRLNFGRDKKAEECAKQIIEEMNKNGNRMP